jgi:hypothetical protein
MPTAVSALKECVEVSLSALTVAAEWRFASSAKACTLLTFDRNRAIAAIGSH